ncbi:MAG TPA: hypothetical protein VIV11_26310 [Kofleriaceae bacterium]
MCTRLAFSCLAAVAALASCGKDAASGDSDPAADAAIDDVPAGYTRLLGSTWQLPVGANVYKCVRVTFAEAMYITSFSTDAPAGTHHAVLALADDTTAGPDGERDCDGGTIGKIMLYASSVGTAPFELPSGVGLEVAAGQQLHLNLHLFNPSDEALAGETAVFAKVQPTPPPTLAEMVLAGPLDISIPSDNQPHAVTGECTATSPYTLFALWPHMHTFAKRQKVELVRGAGASVLHDKEFRFEEQRYYAVEPMTDVAAGERIRVTCTFVNNSGNQVTYGDGAFSEMCFSGLYRFPAADSYEYCGN